MANKQDQFYFDNFVSCADSALQAARILDDTMRDFHPDAIKARIDEIHRVEHEADQKKHEVMDALAKAFITPVDRDDIATLSACLDNVTDKIEDVLLRIYCCNIRRILPGALEMSGVVIRCCEEMKTMLAEFSNFKKSKKLQESIININTLEEEADKLYIESMRQLHTPGTDPAEVIGWRDVYTYLEKCADACEHVADIVEKVKMSNT